MTSRREFMQSTAALLAAGCFHSTRQTDAVSLSSTAPRVLRLPIGFSTLGCPKWTLAQAADFAASHGFSALELRGVLDQMDLSRVPELTTTLPDTQKLLADRHLRIITLGASAE